MENADLTIEALGQSLARHKKGIEKEQRVIATLEQCISAVESAYQGSPVDGGKNLASETIPVATETLPEPTLDASDCVYRCTECCWEVVDGKCQGCEKEFEVLEDQENDSYAGRTQFQRGETPVPSGVSNSPLRDLPAGYDREEYEALIQRGATELMIARYQLTFTPENGIFAYADSYLFDEFSGPQMEQGDKWKIQLGRRLHLDVDDKEGAQFIEGLLEDAFVFPTKNNGWETVQETFGIWVTRLADKTKGDGGVKAAGSTKKEDASAGDEGDDQDGTEDGDENEFHQPVEDGPLRFHDYEDTDTTMGSDEEGEDAEPEDVEMAQAGVIIVASVWDALYESDEEEGGQAARETGSEAGPNAQCGGEIYECDSDTDGSDLSDEMLSGDEIANPSCIGSLPCVSGVAQSKM